MGKMSWISYLCENEMREELIREVSECAESLGRTSEEVADGFLKAHKEIRLQILIGRSGGEEMILQTN